MPRPPATSYLCHALIVRDKRRSRRFGAAAVDSRVHRIATSTQMMIPSLRRINVFTRPRSAAVSNTQIAVKVHVTEQILQELIRAQVLGGTKASSNFIPSGSEKNTA
jgi:hypothetical protein